MAERKRSHDGRSETDEILGDAATPDQQGRAGGQLSRRVGTRDELRRVTEENPGTTRVRGADERATGEDVRDD